MGGSGTMALVALPHGLTSGGGTCIASRHPCHSGYLAHQQRNISNTISTSVASSTYLSKFQTQTLYSMPPLILHNVPDEELYVGEDGIQRPYAMVFSAEPQHNTRSRKPVPETGSFGRSVRRSRSKTGTPARKEDPNFALADSIFTSYVSNLNKRQPRPSNSGDRSAHNNVTFDSETTTIPSQALTKTDRDSEQEPRSLHRPAHIHNVPTEVILRGYHDEQQYAALSHFETLAGRILEDYPRDPPITQRRFKSDLRDATALRPRPLTLEERRKAMAFAGGENWIKITFESEDAAETAIEESPQDIGGFLVFAERYRGVAPTNQDAIPAAAYRQQQQERRNSRSRSSDEKNHKRPFSTLPRSPGVEAPFSKGGLFDHQETPESGTTYDSQILDLSPKRPFTDPNETREHEVYCRRVPTAKRLQLLPASDALMPRQSFGQKLWKKMPLVNRMTSDIAGIPRTESGDFDWAVASFYWKVMWWLDVLLKVFGGDVAGNSKDE